MAVSSLRTDYAAWDPRWLCHSGLTTTEDNTYGIQNVGGPGSVDRVFIKDSSKVAEWKCRGIALLRLVTVPLQVVFQATSLLCYSEIAQISVRSTREETVRAVVQCACTIFEKMPYILLASVVGLPVT